VPVGRVPQGIPDGIEVLCEDGFDEGSGILFPDLFKGIIRWGGVLIARFPKRLVTGLPLVLGTQSQPASGWRAQRGAELDAAVGA
jgi:hypothetical protein